jgi:8-oxo-dGTP pyrophosphatase MutT (NUDIX family)
VVVRQDGPARQYLLVEARRRPGVWVLPKGHVESGETPAETAVREVAEEAGVRGEVVGPLGTTEYSVDGDDVSVDYFLMRYAGETPPTEKRARRWVAYDEALRLLPHRDTRELVARAHAMPV